MIREIARGSKTSLGAFTIGTLCLGTGAIIGGTMAPNPELNLAGAYIGMFWPGIASLLLYTTLAEGERVLRKESSLSMDPSTQYQLEMGASQ